MKRKRLIIWLGLLILALVCGACYCILLILTTTLCISIELLSVDCVLAVWKVKPFESRLVVSRDGRNWIRRRCYRRG
jgi:uncharacterized protein YqgC (DUF456 family)